MKINNEKPTQTARADEAANKAESTKSEKNKDFKELLTGKKDDKSANTRGKPPSTSRGQAKIQDGATHARTGGAGGFRKRLKGGELQLSQQLQQNERLGNERQVTQHHHEARLEHRHRKKHHEKVQSEHTDKGQRGQEPVTPKPDPNSKRQIARPTTRHTSRTAHDVAPQAIQPSPVDAKGSAKAEANAAVEPSKLRADVAELAQKLVERAHLGRDTSGRQIMLLDLQVPGRGHVRVRLRRRGDGFELRMRPENEAFARDLRREREHFRQSAAESGVDFTSIEIV